MQSHSKQYSRKFRITRGVTILEFVGCLAALGGGVVLGSIYLGVDVQTLAAGILEKADIDVPAILGNSSKASEDSPVEDALEADALETVNDEAVVSQEGEETAANVELEALDSDKTSSDSVEQKELTDEEKLAATQDCWLALNQSIQEEVTNRSNWMNDSQSWQLFDYLLFRKKGHEKVVEAIEQLDHHGVDPRLQAYVQQVLTWHRAGEELFDRAAQLLTDAPAGKLSGPFAQSWQSAATQHRMEEKLILNKHAAVDSYLEHTRKMAASPASE